LEEQFSGLYSGKLLLDFSLIRIRDSTKMMIPSGLESNYCSCGGDIHSRSKAGISIQYEYDLKSAKITDLDITPGNCNDRTEAVATAEQKEIYQLMQKNEITEKELFVYIGNQNRSLTACNRAFSNPDRIKSYMLLE
jgi:hypothetical protein